MSAHNGVIATSTITRFGRDVFRWKLSQFPPHPEHPRSDWNRGLKAEWFAAFASARTKIRGGVPS